MPWGKGHAAATGALRSLPKPSRQRRETTTGCLNGCSRSVRRAGPLERECCRLNWAREMTIPRTLGAAHGRRMKHVHVYIYIYIYTCTYVYL